MTRREQYTAYSRCTNGNNVRIVSLDKDFEDDEVNYVIYQWKCKDESIKDCYIGYTNNFDVRRKGHIDSINDTSNTLKVYEFIRNNGGLDNWTCEIVNKFFAMNKQEARQVEQLYINSYNSTLNDCASCKFLEDQRVKFYF